MNRVTGDLRKVSTSLWKMALLVYAVSLASRTVLMSAVYAPDLERFSRPLATALQFLVTELQALTQPMLATALVIGALVCHPILSTRAPADAETDE